jgi:hypothetical protein
MIQSIFGRITTTSDRTFNLPESDNVSRTIRMAQGWQFDAMKQRLAQCYSENSVDEFLASIVGWFLDMTDRLLAAYAPIEYRETRPIQSVDREVF